MRSRGVVQHDPNGLNVNADRRRLMNVENSNATSPMTLLQNMFDVEMSFMKSETKDVLLLARAFHHDVVIHEPESLPYRGDWRGLQGVADLFQKMHETFSDMRVDELSCSAMGETIFVSCILTATSRKSAAVIRQPFA